MASKERCQDAADDILKPTQTHDIARNERSALEITRSDTATVKWQQDIRRVTLHSRKAEVSRCHQANTMQYVDTPGSLDMNHPLALSMTPSEPTAVPQTAECGTPKFPLEAEHLSQQSVPSQLLQQLHPLSQNLSEMADFEESAPSTLPRYIKILSKPHNPQNCSPSNGWGAITKSFTKDSSHVRASRSTMERLVRKIKETNLEHRKPSKFTSSGYPKVIVYPADARLRSLVEVAFDIVAEFAETIKQQPSSSTEDQLMFYCLCKVLYVMGIKISRLSGLQLNPEIEVSFKLLQRYFEGVVWANMLLYDLWKEGWGHEAVDFLLSWDLSIKDYARFEQSGSRSIYKESETPGSTITETVRPDYRNELMEFLKDPKYRARCLPILSYESISLPARVGKILGGIVPYDDICIALRCHQLVEEPITWHESHPIAKVVWDAQHDSDHISLRSRIRSDITRDTISIESSRQAQSSLNARDPLYTSRFDMLAQSALTHPKFPAAQKLVWDTPEVKSSRSPYRRECKMSKDMGNIKSSRPDQSSSNGETVAPTKNVHMLGDLASTRSSVPAVQNLNWNPPRDLRYISPPYSNESDISNNTISINSSRQNRDYSNTRDQAPRNDFHMLLNPAPTCPKEPALQSLNWSASHDTGPISPPHSSGSAISSSTRSNDSSHQTQSSSKSRDHAHTNDFDMLLNPAPTSPKGPALQSLNWSASHDTGPISPPHRSGSVISNTTRSIDSSLQAQSSSKSRDHAHTIDFDMLADSATTGTDPQASEEMEWSIDSNISKIAQDSWNGGGCHLAQSAWEATNFAFLIEHDMQGNSMQGDSMQSISKVYPGVSDRYCDQWLKA